MFLNLFEERDKSVNNLIKLGDCLGRSLRENLMLFSIDASQQKVIYLSENNKVIAGNYEFFPKIKLKNIVIEDSTIFEDSEMFDNIVNEKINSFVENIHFGDYSEADNSFEDVLSLWNQRAKLDSIQKKLYEKSEKLQSVEKIIESDEFNNLLEIKTQFSSFLEENFDKISKVPEIINGVNLSNIVSEAFNSPKITLEELENEGSFEISEEFNTSVYEMICRQELVKKELVESKTNFDLVWANNDSIKNLASLIFEDDETVVKGLCEAIKEVPYIAIASKKQLFNTFSNCLGMVDGLGISESDIKTFASKIFEYKKEVKEGFINNLNEKYGININNLQEPVSFKSLINTQVVIFESLARLAPKKSVLKGVLSDLSESLKAKTGVESIDLNNFLLEMFVETGYGDLLEESAVKEKPKTVLKKSPKVSELGGQYDDEENVDQASLEKKEKSDEKTSKAEKEEEKEEEEAFEKSKKSTKTKDDVLDDFSKLEKLVGDIVDDISKKPTKDTYEKKQKDLGEEDADVGEDE